MAHLPTCRDEEEEVVVDGRRTVDYGDVFAELSLRHEQDIFMCSNLFNSSIPRRTFTAKSWADAERKRRRMWVVVGNLINRKGHWITSNLNVCLWIDLVDLLNGYKWRHNYAN